MRIAMLPPEQFKLIIEFNQAAEAFIEREKFSFTEPFNKWKEWHDDDEDKMLVMKIQKELIANEDMEEGQIDSRIIAYEFMARKYSNRLSHAILIAEVLIDNCCDPSKDYLDFHPSIYHNHVAPEQ